MPNVIQPPPLEKHEIILQTRRLERESEERRLSKLKARLIAKRPEARKAVVPASYSLST